MPSVADPSRPAGEPGAGPPEAETPEASAREADLLRVLPREELLASLSGLRTLCQQYRTLQEHIWDDDAPDAEAQSLLARHRELARDETGPFDAVSAAGALLDYVVNRLRTSELVFHLRSEAPRLPDHDGDSNGIGTLTRQLRELQAPLENLAAHVFTLAQGAPTLGGGRTQRLLYPIAALFKAIVRQDWADADLVLNHLNMVSTSRENHELTEQIGRLVRSIYDSLNEISRSVPIDSLSNVSEEIPDAVDKLGSVIAELEDGTNRNLDLLEILTAYVRDARTMLEAAQLALAECDGELGALTREAPEAAAELEEVRGLLEQEVMERLTGFAEHLEEAYHLYMTLFANQSYQDLTGQTLKKVIAFIEGLQYQLIQVISKDHGEPTVGVPTNSHDSTIQSGPDAHNRLSQDKVDSMLAELGF
ncbi:MAG TPA: protein phosphatase CheZ [bacterium]|nr:protein phosphatase CheZ [bacterium]